LAAGKFLRLRGGTYHCRIRVPRLLQSVFNRREFVLSLRTGRFASALRAARSIRVGLDQIMSALESGQSPAAIERAIRGWVSQVAQDYDCVLAVNDGALKLLSQAEAEAMGEEDAGELEALFQFAHATMLEEAAAGFKKAVTTPPPAKVSAAIDRVARQAASDTGLDFPSGSLEAKLFRRALTRNLSGLLDVQLALARGEPMPDHILQWVAPMARMAPPIAATPPLANADRMISELWPEFCEAKINNAEWKPGERISAETTLKLWIGAERDGAPREYSTLNVGHFQKTFRGLPRDYYHNKAFKKIYEEEGVLALFEKTRTLENCARTVPKTWNKHLSRLNEFFKWAGEKGQALPKDKASICEGYFIRIPKSRRGKRLRQSLRETFDDRAITALTTAPKFLGCASQSRWKTPGEQVFRDHRYWITLIGLLHGMRREEPILLQVKHVKCEEGVWHFDLLDPKLEPFLKDIGSPRKVPLHRDFLELGFIEARVAGRDPEARLFPEAVSHSEIGKDGGPFGKWFLAFRVSVGVSADELDFHSCRHTVINRLVEAGVPEAHVEELCGHEGEERRSELSTYRHGMLLQTLKAAVDRLVIPLDVAALKEAVRRSDAIDRSAAWPNLDCPSIVPKPRKRRASQGRSQARE
jgi:integrase